MSSEQCLFYHMHSIQNCDEFKNVKHQIWSPEITGFQIFRRIFFILLPPGVVLDYARVSMIEI